MLPMISDLEAMSTALSEARNAAETGEVPIGAVIVHDGAIIAHGQNSVIRTSDPPRTPKLLLFGMRLLFWATTASTAAPCTSRWSPAPCVQER